MTTPIIIPCYFHTDETATACDMSERLDIDVDISDADFDVKDIYFYSINYLMPHKYSDGSLIGSNGEEFRSPLKMEEIADMINESNK